MQDQKALKKSILEMFDDATAPLSCLYEILEDVQPGDTVEAGSVAVVLKALLQHADHEIRSEISNILYVPAPEEVAEIEENRAVMRDINAAMAMVGVRVEAGKRERAEAKARMERGEQSGHSAETEELSA